MSYRTPKLVLWRGLSKLPKALTRSSLVSYCHLVGAEILTAVFRAQTTSEPKFQNFFETWWCQFVLGRFVGKLPKLYSPLVTLFLTLGKNSNIFSSIARNSYLHCGILPSYANRSLDGEGGAGAGKHTLLIT